jgi:ADP-ribose pyrophosphatase YjhB (NUDIX family)
MRGITSLSTIKHHSAIPSDIPRVFIHEHTPLRSEYAILTHEQYCHFPDGNGGYQGVVPWFMDQNGAIQCILNLSKKHQLLSYIGGGLRVSETPVDSLYREIEEETPQWKDYLIKLLNDPMYPRMVLIKDEYYPNHPGKNRAHIRLSTLIYLRVDPNIMNEMTFQPSKEVAQLHIIPLDEIPFYTPPPSYKVIWDGTENGLSNGLNEVVYNLSNPILFGFLWAYIKKNITKAEYTSYLKWLYETNNVTNKMEWDNEMNGSESLSSHSIQSSMKSPRLSTQKSSRKSVTKKKKRTKKTK